MSSRYVEADGPVNGEDGVEDAAAENSGGEAGGGSDLGHLSLMAARDRKHVLDQVERGCR